MRRSGARMVTAEQIAEALGGKRTGDGWLCCCPAHDDRNPSLSVGDGETGIVVHCFAGCAQGDVLAALRDRGLWPAPERKTPPAKPQAPTWVYTDASGSPVLGVKRFATADGGKTFRQSTPDGNGWRFGGLPRGTPPPLYGLPLPDGTVVVVEGEKARDAATGALQGIPGFVVTCWPGGCANARYVDLTPLQGRTVVLWPDADPPGIAAMQTVAQRLSGIAAAVHVVDVADLPKSADAADLDPEEVRRRITAALDHGEESRTPASIWPAPVDVAALLATDPVPPASIIADWLPCGYATMLAGHGGAGKSSIALHLAACIATGADFFGLPTERRRVLYLSCEDRADVLHWRLARIVRHAGITDLAEHLTLMDLVGHDALLWRQDAPETPAYGALRDLIRSTGAEVLIVDGAADAFGGNENDRAQVKQFINALVGLVPPHGAALLLHHVNKQSAGAAVAEGYSGSTGWHNAVRARWYLHPETERTDDGLAPTGDLLLDLQKSNLGRAGQSMRFRWDAETHLFVGELAAGASKFEAREIEREELDGIVAALREVIASGSYVPTAATGCRTAYHVLSAAEAFPKTLRDSAGRKRFWRHVERLRLMREISTAVIQHSNRHVTDIFVPNPLIGMAAPNASNAIFEHSHDSTQGAPAPNAPNGAGGYIRGVFDAPAQPTAEAYRAATRGD